MVKTIDIVNGTSYAQLTMSTHFMNYFVFFCFKFLYLRPDSQYLGGVWLEGMLSWAGIMPANLVTYFSKNH